MSGAHTPGPWYTKRGLTQMVSTDTTVAQVGQRTGEEDQAWWIFSPAEIHGDSEADARLIAAAPELLQALLALHANMRAQDLEVEAQRPTETEYQQCMRDAEAAIAKATETAS